MTALILSIIASSSIFAIFKLFTKYKVDTFQAIVFNYFTAFACGYLFTNKPWTHVSENLTNWGFYAIIAALLFISLFLIMGKSSQLNGVARTSVATKMSMSVSLIAMIIYYSESIEFLKIVGILLAFIGVILTSISESNEKSSATWMLFVLFIGSGLLDFVLNIVQSLPFTQFNSSMFTAFGFLAAGTLGLVFMLIQLGRRKIVFQWKNVLAGIILGIPNYFSINMLIESYSQLDWQDSTVLSVLNVSIVLLASILGFVFFKEKLTKFKLIGLISAVSAIVVLYIVS